MFDKDKTGKLGHAAGYKSKDTGAKVFRKIGEMIADHLGIEMPEEPEPNAKDPARLLASGTAAGKDDAPLVWDMHPELRSAVRVTF